MPIYDRIFNADTGLAPNGWTSFNSPAGFIESITSNGTPLDYYGDTVSGTTANPLAIFTNANFNTSNQLVIDISWTLTDLVVNGIMQIALNNATESSTLSITYDSSVPELRFSFSDPQVSSNQSFPLNSSADYVSIRVEFNRLSKVLTILMARDGMSPDQITSGSLAGDAWPEEVAVFQELETGNGEQASYSLALGTVVHAVILQSNPLFAEGGGSYQSVSVDIAPTINNSILRYKFIHAPPDPTYLDNGIVYMRFGGIEVSEIRVAHDATFDDIVYATPLNDFEEYELAILANGSPGSYNAVVLNSSAQTMGSLVFNTTLASNTQMTMVNKTTASNSFYYGLVTRIYFHTEFTSQPPTGLVVASLTPNLVDITCDPNPVQASFVKWELSVFANFSSVLDSSQQNLGVSFALIPGQTYYVRAFYTQPSAGYNGADISLASGVLNFTAPTTASLPVLSGYRGVSNFSLISGGGPNALPPVFAPRNPTPEMRITANPIAGTPNIYYSGDGLPDGGVPYELEGVIDFAFGASGPYGGIQDHLDYIKNLRDVVMSCTELWYTAGTDVYKLEIQPDFDSFYTQGGAVIRHEVGGRPWISRIVIQLNVKTPAWSRLSGGEVGAII